MASPGLPAWVGRECLEPPKRLEDHLAKRTVGAQGREKVVAGKSRTGEPTRSPQPDGPLPDRARRPGLVLIRLHGADASDPRTAFRAGFPLVGDVKYGGRAAGRLKLHAVRLQVERKPIGFAAVGSRGALRTCRPNGRMSEMYFPLRKSSFAVRTAAGRVWQSSFFVDGWDFRRVLLPFQMTFLGYTNTSVSATNQLYNVFSNPGGVFRYYRENGCSGLSWIVMAGRAVPGSSSAVLSASTGWRIQPSSCSWRSCCSAAWR